jgi:hypothetical protein
MWFWTRLPALVRRVAGFPAAALLDGVYLWEWPGVARYASGVALTLGAVIAWQHPGYRYVFTESLPLLLFVVALGVFSGHLGTLFLAGFVAADAILFRDILETSRPLMRAFNLSGALVIQYGLLAAVLMALPVVTKALLTSLVRSRFDPVRVAVAVIGHVLITAGLTYAWVNSVPLLMRPMFTWQRMDPTAAAAVPLQQDGVYVVMVAAAASMVRILLEAWLAGRPTNDPILVVEQAGRALSSTQPLSERLPAAARIGLRAGWTVLMFSGMYGGWGDASIILALVAVLSAIRFQIIRIPLLRWSRLMDRIPVLVRILAGTALVYVIAYRLLLVDMRTNPTFRPLLIVTGLSLILFFVLNPGIARRASETRGGP